MSKISIYADNIVGLECTLFLISNYSEDIVNIVVTDKSSIVYEELMQIKFDKEKILFYADISDDDQEYVDYIFLLWWPHLINEKLKNSVKKVLLIHTLVYCRTIEASTLIFGI